VGSTTDTPVSSPGNAPAAGTLFQDAALWTASKQSGQGAYYQPQANATGVTISGTTMTLGTLTYGTPAIGQRVAGFNVTEGTIITGGSGLSWTVSPSQTVSTPTEVSLSVASSHPPAWNINCSDYACGIHSDTHMYNPASTADQAFLPHGCTYLSSGSPQGNTAYIKCTGATTGDVSFGSIGAGNNTGWDLGPHTGDGTAADPSHDCIMVVATSNYAAGHTVHVYNSRIVNGDDCAANSTANLFYFESLGSANLDMEYDYINGEAFQPFAQSSVVGSITAGVATITISSVNSGRWYPNQVVQGLADDSTLISIPITQAGSTPGTYTLSTTTTHAATNATFTITQSAPEIQFSSTGSFTALYNVLINGLEPFYSFSPGNAPTANTTIVIKYNYMKGMIVAGNPAHGGMIAAEWTGVAGGPPGATRPLVQFSYNTAVQPAGYKFGGLTTFFNTYGANCAGGSIPNCATMTLAQLDHNISISNTYDGSHGATLSNYTVSDSLFHLQSSIFTQVVANNNFTDPSGALYCVGATGYLSSQTPPSTDHAPPIGTGPSYNSTPTYGSGKNSNIDLLDGSVINNTSNATGGWEICPGGVLGPTP
jgi:hypothetical protein